MPVVMFERYYGWRVSQPDVIACSSFYSSSISRYSFHNLFCAKLMEDLVVKEKKRKEKKSLVLNVSILVSADVQMANSKFRSPVNPQFLHTQQGGV